MLSMDMQVGFYAFGIAPEDNDYFTVDYRGKRYYRRACPPMGGWNLSHYYLCSFTAAFIRHPHPPDFTFASMASRAQFFFLAIKPARFYLRELHYDVLLTKDSWSGRVKMTHLLRRVLEWLAAILGHINGRSICTLVDTVYMHVDSSGYGWGAVLNETTEARGFKYDGDRELHITYKAVRYTVLTVLSELRGRQVLIHEDNMVVVHILASLTSPSPLLMTELRKP
eukprot:jgi/Tetstr1/464403/TSEL_009196.t1